MRVLFGFPDSVAHQAGGTGILVPLFKGDLGGYRQLSVLNITFQIASQSMQGKHKALPLQYLFNKSQISCHKQKQLIQQPSSGQLSVL